MAEEHDDQIPTEEMPAEHLEEVTETEEAEQPTAEFAALASSSDEAIQSDLQRYTELRQKQDTEEGLTDEEVEELSAVIERLKAAEAEPPQNGHAPEGNNDEAATEGTESIQKEEEATDVTQPDATNLPVVVATDDYEIIEVKQEMTPEIAESLLERFHDVHGRLKRKEAQRKTITTKLNLQVKELEAKVDKIYEDIETKIQRVDVRCRWYRNYEKGRAELRQIHDEVVVRTRPLTEEEAQMQFNLPAEPRPVTEPATVDEQPDVETPEEGAPDPEEINHSLPLNPAEEHVDSFILKLRFNLSKIKLIQFDPMFREIIEHIIDRKDREHPDYWPGAFPRNGKFFGIPYEEDSSVGTEGYRFLNEAGEVLLETSTPLEEAIAEAEGELPEALVEEQTETNAPETSDGNPLQIDTNGTGAAGVITATNADSNPKIIHLETTDTSSKGTQENSSEDAPPEPAPKKRRGRPKKNQPE